MTRLWAERAPSAKGRQGGEGKLGVALESLQGLMERERVGRFGRMALKHVKYHV